MTFQRTKRWGKRALVSTGSAPEPDPVVPTGTLVDLSGEGDADTVRALQIAFGPMLSAYSEDTAVKNKYWDRHRDGIDERLTLLEDACTRMWPDSGGKTITLTQGSSTVTTSWDVTGYSNFVMIEAGPNEREYAWISGTGTNTASMYYAMRAVYEGTNAGLWSWPHATPGAAVSVRLYVGDVANNDVYSANYYQSLGSAYGLGYMLKDRALRDSDAVLLAEAEALLTRIDGAVDLFARWHGFFEGRTPGNQYDTGGWGIDAKAFDYPALAIRMLRGREEWRESLALAGSAYMYIPYRDRNVVGVTQSEVRNPGFAMEMAAIGAAIDLDLTRRATLIQRMMEAVGWFRGMMSNDPKGRWNTVYATYWVHDDTGVEYPNNVNQPFTTAHGFAGLAAAWRCIQSDPALVTQYAGTTAGKTGYLEETYLLAAQQLVPAWLGPVGTWTLPVMRGMRYYEREGMRYTGLTGQEADGALINDYSGDISGGGFYNRATHFTDHAYASLRTIATMQASNAAFAYALMLRRGESGATAETYRQIAEDAMEASYAYDLGDGKRGAWDIKTTFSNTENKRWGQAFLRTRTIYAYLRGHLGY